MQIKAKSLRDKALALEKRAQDTKDYGNYILCGLAFQDIYNRNPEDPKNDEVLYNAGVCFEEGKSIGAAISTFNTLQKYYPNSKITAKAVARLGKAYGDIAFYDRASDKLEEYAKKYAGEKDAHDAMNDAVLYRKGLGDDQKAIDDTKYFIKTFGPKNKEDAANASFSLTSIYEKGQTPADKDAVVKHLREYLREFGSVSADKAIIANVKIGQILFEQSCPVKQIDGSCVKVTRERAVAKEQKRTTNKKKKDVYVAPMQCGPDTHIKLTVVKRDDRKLREALAAFTAAEKSFEGKSGKVGGDEGGARYYYGLAKFAEADVEFEKYLDIHFPTNLNFGDGLPEHKAVAAKAQKRFNDWLEGKTKSSVAAATKYAKVLEIKDAANSIAAAARIGQISQDFSDQLFTAEIPKEVRATQMIEGYDLAQDKVDAYCDALTTAAEPLANKSLEAFGACLSKSTELGWFSDWSKLCERELGQIKPEEYPTASELRGDSDQVAPVIAVEPPTKVD
jgi:tetratricopeptide (TPR) repeat protein